MQANRVHFRPVIILGILLGTLGCSPKQDESKKVQPPVVQSKHELTEEDWLSKRVSNRPGNTMGKVFIVMYHHFKAGHGDLYRTPKQFRHDLDTYYKMGFRPVLASEYLANKMRLAPGAMPIILTFDDSNPTQLHLLADGSVDPNCAVGVWQQFAKEHPDFPVHGTFCVLPVTMWGQIHKFRDKKIKIILDLGSELESHTMSHPFLNRLPDDRVKKELGNANLWLEKVGQKPPISLALPYGVLPRNTQLFYGFMWKGHKIHFPGVFLAAGNPAPSPNDPKFKRFRIPRMAGNWDGDAVGFFLRKLKAGKVQPYVQP